MICRSGARVFLDTTTAQSVSLPSIVDKLRGVEAALKLGLALPESPEPVAPAPEAPRVTFADYAAAYLRKV